MKKRFFIFFVIIIFVFPLIIFAGAPGGTIKITKSGSKKAAVMFPHGKHKKAKCRSCHHKGNRNQKCSTCHKGAKAKKNLHKKCRGCHKKQGGPTKCKACHK